MIKEIIHGSIIGFVIGSVIMVIDAVFNTSFGIEILKYFGIL